MIVTTKKMVSEIIKANSHMEKTYLTDYKNAGIST